jgi:hypothetical protein
MVNRIAAPTARLWEHRACRPRLRFSSSKQFTYPNGIEREDDIELGASRLYWKRLTRSSTLRNGSRRRLLLDRDGAGEAGAAPCARYERRRPSGKSKVLSVRHREDFWLARWNPAAPRRMVRRNRLVRCASAENSRHPSRAVRSLLRLIGALVIATEFT